MKLGQGIAAVGVAAGLYVASQHDAVARKRMGTEAADLRMKIVTASMTAEYLGQGDAAEVCLDNGKVCEARAGMNGGLDATIACRAATLQCLQDVNLSVSHKEH